MLGAPRHDLAILQSCNPDMNHIIIYIMIYYDIYTYNVIRDFSGRVRLRRCDVYQLEPGLQRRQKLQIRMGRGRSGMHGLNLHQNS